MRLAIVRLSAMGDIIQSMVVLQFIKTSIPNASIDWVVDTHFASLLEECPYIDNIIRLDIKEIKESKSIFQLFVILNKLRKLKKYDLVFDLQGLIKSAIITRFIPSDERIGFDRKSTREKLASCFYSKRYYFPYQTNVIKRYLGLVVSSLELEIDNRDILDKKPFFYLSQNKFESNKPNVVIVLGASFPSKIYPVEKYAEVVKSLQVKFIALWGSEKEKLMAHRLSLIAPNVEVSNKLDFKQLLILISNANLVIGGDTGPTHLAWALNKPSIMLFGPTNADRNSFQTKINLTLSSEYNSPVTKISKTESSIDNIPFQDVVRLAKGLIKCK